MVVPILARIVVHGLVKTAADIEHRLAAFVDDAAGRLLFMGQSLQYACGKLPVFPFPSFIPRLVVWRQQRRHVADSRPWSGQGISEGHRRRPVFIIEIQRIPTVGACLAAAP